MKDGFRIFWFNEMCMEVLQKIQSLKFQRKEFNYYIWYSSKDGAFK